MTILKAEHLSFSYRTKYQTIHAVQDISCEFDTGKMYAVTGESGSGKTTLLSLLAGLDLPESGKVTVRGNDLSQMNRDKYRREQASVIYQAFHLFPMLTALENVMFPMELRNMKKKAAKERAKKLLLQVGLSEKIFSQFPQMMSGGEQQRVSIARALAKNPKLLLCDEPTGALDYQTGKAILKLLQDTCREKGVTVIVITHNSAIAPMADRVIEIKNGRVETMRVNPEPVGVETIEW